MLEKKISILAKPYVDNSMVKAIHQLELDATKTEQLHFKFELEYKLADAFEKQKQGIPGRPSEFLAYDGDQLIGYTGICFFGGNESEVNGLVAPAYRRNGVFTKIIQEVETELLSRGHKTYLALVDQLSSSGMAWVNAKQGVLDHVEYEMLLPEETTIESLSKGIVLRLATNADAQIIYQMNRAFEEGEFDPSFLPEEEAKRGMEIMLIERENQIIGKIHLQYFGDEAWIFGFVIDSAHRGKQLGKAALHESILWMRAKGVHKIYLQVDSENPIAYSLYQKVGFHNLYAMAYYRIKLL